MDTSNERKVSRRKDDDEDDLSVLQEDLLVQILSKLSVKDVVRCRSVSKHWYALTKSTYFANIHFVDHCHDDDDHPSMIFIRDLREGIFKGETSICGISLLHDGKDEAISLKLPLLFRNRDIDFVGCSNGLVCIRLNDQIVDNNHEKVTTYKILVWNPTTKKHRIIPQPVASNLHFLTQGEKDDITRYHPHVGFGFVHHDMIVSTEYNLVRFFCHYTNKDADDHRVTFRALEFVQRTNSWNATKNEVEITSFQRSYRNTTTLNSVVYWKVHLQEQECGVMSFDLRHQVFNLTKLHIDLENRRNWAESDLYSWRSSLITYTCNILVNNAYVITMWTINCSSGSIDGPIWTPLLKLDSSVLPRQLKVVLGSWKDQLMFALIVRRSDVRFYEDPDKYRCFRKQLFSYDIKTHDMKTNILKSEERICQALLNYTRTLASV